MGSDNYVRAQTGRAAAVLTNSEVAGTAFVLANAADKSLVVDLTFTIGSLTNAVVRFYGSMDNSTYDPIALNGAVITETLSADAERMYVIPPLPGVKWFLVSVEGSGTVTGSSCAFVYRYNRPRSLAG